MRIGTGVRPFYDAEAMRPRAIVVYWLLLLVPTLAAGLALILLLRHERERLEQAARRAAEDQVRLAADNVALIVADVREETMAGLAGMNAADPAPALRAWAERNPLIRNVFVWAPGRGLRLPDPAGSLTGEESSFLARYESLFSGSQPFGAAPEDGGAGLAQQQAQPQREESWLSADSYQSVRREVRAAVRKGQAAQQAIEAGPPPRSGWIPWFWGDRFSMLGWVQPAPGGAVYGVEIELAALLSRLGAALPRAVPAGRACTLEDGNGRIVHAAGDEVGDPRPPRLASAAVGAALPHWQAVVYATGPQYGAAWGRLFLAVSTLLALIFVAAVVSGGSLLLWQAHRNGLDARRKTSFVSNVSHELKTPLTTIRMYAEMLGEGRVRDEERRRHYLEVMIRESQRLTRLVNNVLDFSRLEQGRKKYRAERVDVVAVARDVAGTLDGRLRQAGLAVELAAPAEPCEALVDRDSLEQGLLNLVDNAVKYAAEGGVLRLAVSASGGRVALEVADRGPGIPAAHRARIFEQFHRVDDALTARQPGCGLGLSISRRLFRDQGGDLTYEPAPGGGSVFTIRLPAAPGRPAGAPGAGEGGPP